MSGLKRKFDHMSALVDEAAVLLDAQGKVVEANAAMLSLLDQQIAGLPMERFLRHPDFTRALQEALSGDKIAELDYSRMDQVRREFKLRVAPFEPGFVMLVLEDITEGSSVDRIRTDFVANVSHELRSPLTALSGFIETLIDGAAEDPQARDNFLGIMQSEAGRMQRLIDDLLSLSRVQAEAHRLPSGLVDMRLVLPQITSLLAGQADKRDMRLAVTFDADLGTDALSVVGHADELQQVFVNLIENAIRYGDAGSDVRLVVGKGRMTPAQAPVDNLLRVQVFNQGPVIPDEHIGRLTERFYRIDKGRSRQMGGTGLGLAIVKHIINRHRGRLRVTSSPENTCFAVTLPRRPAD